MSSRMSRYQSIADCDEANRRHYSDLVARLWDRYSDGNGIVVSNGGVPTKYKRLIDSAFTRYVVNHGVR